MKRLGIREGSVPPAIRELFRSASKNIDSKDNRSRRVKLRLTQDGRFWVLTIVRNVDGGTSILRRPKDPVRPKPKPDPEPVLDLTPETEEPELNVT